MLAAREVELLARHGSAVVFNVKARDRQLEIVGIEAIHCHGVGVCLERVVADAALVLQAQETKAQVVDPKTIQVVGLLGQRLGTVNAATGVANKGGDVGAANRKALGAAHCGTRAVFEGIGVIDILKTYGTAEVQEVRDRQRGTLCIDPHLLTVEVNHDVACRAQGQAAIERLGVVDDAFAGVGAGVTKAQAICCELEDARVNAIQAGVVHARFDCGVRLPAGVGHQDPKVHTLNPKTVEVIGLLGEGFGGVKSAIGITYKRGDVGARDGHHRFGLHRTLAAVRVLDDQRRGWGVFLKTDAALEHGKVKQLERHIAFGAQQLAR